MAFFAASRDMGMDIGTSNTLLYTKDKGIILREPSVIAINAKNKKVLAVGSEAKEMIGRVPEHIQVIRPLKNGVIANFDVCQQMLQKFVEKAARRRGFKGSRVVLCYPSGVTEVEKRAINDLADRSGALKSMMIEEPVAAALGAGLPVDDAIGSMIVDIGGGTTDIAAISLGGIVTSKSLRSGGNELDEAIINYIKREFDLLIGEVTAENIKIELGSACLDKDEEERTLQTTGRDLITGLPRVITVSESDIKEATKDLVATVIEAIRATIEETPPELAADIMDSGITLCGGGALLKGLDKLIYDRMHIPVNIAENPLDCVVLGAGKCLSMLNKLKKS